MVAKSPEPISTISAVLTMRQIVWLTEEASRRGISRTSVIRDAVERGIAAIEAGEPKRETEQEQAA